MELGLLNYLGINDACDLALANQCNVRAELSPHYNRNCKQLVPTQEMVSIGGQSDGRLKVVIDTSSAMEYGYITVRTEEICNCT